MKQSYSITSIEIGPMENFIYFITDRATQRTAIVDPAWDAGTILQTAKKNGFVVSDILLTHSHHDHVNAVGDILSETDAQLHLLKTEAIFWGNHEFKPTLHHGGGEVMLGESHIKLLHTPGHTPGSCCYHVGNDLIAGDTLFVFGCGRCDLQGGDPETMFNTLKNIRTTLPTDTIIRPGHNYATKETCTLQEQIEGNPFLHFDSKNDFVNYRMHTHSKTRSTPYGAVSKEKLLASLK